MAEKSKIQWTDATWNPATGCTRVSPGCAHCYIERTPPFRVNHRKFDPKTGTTGIMLHEDRLYQPLRWKRPRRIFVNSLSDLFHESIPDEFIAHVFAVMALAPQHTFQILTKRPWRIREFFRYDEAVRRRILGVAGEMLGCPTLGEYFHGIILDRRFPLKNVWLGVTCENQHFADERIPLLLQTPAAVRFVSYEPALEAVSFCNSPMPDGDRTGLGWNDGCEAQINWLICGGESGPKARPMDLAWARSARDQCRDAGVPFFMKQICSGKGRPIPMGEWPEDLRVREYPANGVS